MYDADAVGLIQIPDIKKNNDYAMWLKVCKKANCYLLDETLARYRKRSGSISNHGYMKLIKWHYKLYREADVYKRQAFRTAPAGLRRTVDKNRRRQSAAGLCGYAEALFLCAAAVSYTHLDVYKRQAQSRRYLE